MFYFYLTIIMKFYLFYLYSQEKKGNKINNIEMNSGLSVCKN